MKEIVNNLSERFPEYSSESVCGQAQVFIPENFPTVNAEVIDYGNENVSKLADFYNVDGEGACDEWRNFKYEVMINRHSDDNWRKILTIAAKRNRDWPTLSQLANVLLTSNADSTTVERGFNLLSRLRTPTRNRLLSSTADKLMRLKLNAASYKTFNHNRAYALWLQSSTRSRCNVSGSVSKTEVNEINTYNNR